jgi:hypothetical protein
MLIAWKWLCVFLCHPFSATNNRQGHQYNFPVVQRWANHFTDYIICLKMPHIWFGLVCSSDRMGFGLPFKITTLLSAKLKELTVLNLNLIHSTYFCFPILRRLNEALWCGLEQVWVGCSTGLCLPSTKHILYYCLFSLHFFSLLITRPTRNVIKNEIPLFTTLQHCIFHYLNHN